MADTRLEQKAPLAGRASRPRRPRASSGAVAGRVHIGKGDRYALTLLVLLPIVVIVPFSVFGHPLLQGDNLTQNYPLRVLVGEEMAAGHLPTWNSLIWSGTPLLAGWNAGAMFPGTWLFALLPHLAAWTINELVAPVLGGVGTYLLLRRLGAGPLASCIAALAFAETGFMSGQVVHLGLVQGTAMLPWSLLGIEAIADALARRRAGIGALGGVLLLGISLALTVLAGDPRAVSTAAAAIVLYCAAHLIRAGRRATRLVRPLVLGGVLAVAASAIQWWPGLSFLRSSQRGQAAYDFYGGGSLTGLHLLMYLALPFGDGGNGNFGMPVYGGNYNLPEITIGVGVLALVAVFAFLPALGADVANWWRRRRRGFATTPGPHRLGVWYVMALVGIALTLGSSTPLGHLFVHIPLFGAERLQNRNAELLDMALVVLLGFFCDDLLRRRAARTGDADPGVPAPSILPVATSSASAPSVLSSVGAPIRGAGGAPISAPTPNGSGANGASTGAEPVPDEGRRALASRWSRRLALVPVVGTAAFLVFSIAAAGSAAQAWGNPSAPSGLPGRNAGYFAVMALVLAGAAALVVRARRLDPRTLRRLLVGTAALDIGIFVALASYASAPASVLAGPTQQSAIIKRLAGRVGRFALYNPLQSNPTSDPQFLRRLGITDINILHRNPSVQGYGSIVDSTYAAATASHTFEDLNIARLPSETFNTLDLSVLVTPPVYLYTVLPNDAPIPVAPGEGVSYFGRRVSGATVPSVPPDAIGPLPLGAGTRSTFQLGIPRDVARVDVVLAPGASTPARLSLRFASANGKKGASRLVPVRAGQAHLVLARPLDAAVLRVGDPTKTGTVIGAVVVTTKHPAERLLLDGALQGLLLPPHWRYLSRIGPFVAYRNTETRGLAWLQPPSKHTPNVFDRAPGSVTTSLTSALVPEQMVVHNPKPALLVRSETYEPGWTARLTPIGGGASRVLAVHRFGLVQVVDLPAGDFQIVWQYSPRSVLEGLVLSGLAAASSAAGVVVLIVRRRRRQRLATMSPGDSLH